MSLGSVRKIKTVTLGALQDIKSWIWFPKNVKIEYSADGETYKEVSVTQYSGPRDQYGAMTFDYVTSKKIKAKYLRITAENFGPNPDWHLGKGEPTWLFFDEIVIE